MERVFRWPFPFRLWGGSAMIIPRMLPRHFLIPIFTLFLVLRVGPSALHAQGCSVTDLASCPTDRIVVPTTSICETPQECVRWALNVTFVITVFLVFIYTIWGGIDYITHGDNPSEIIKAQNKIKYSFLGLFIVMIAWGVTAAFISLFGIDPTILPGTP